MPQHQRICLTNLGRKKYIILFRVRVFRLFSNKIISYRFEYFSRVVPPDNHQVFLLSVFCLKRCRPLVTVDF